MSLLVVPAIAAMWFDGFANCREGILTFSADSGVKQLVSEMLGVLGYFFVLLKSSLITNFMLFSE